MKLDLTREQAITAMSLGSTVRHMFFTSNEWVKFNGIQFEFEDGVTCNQKEMWQYRTGGYWETGWSIVDETPSSNDIVIEEKRAEAIRFYNWLHREGYSFSDRPYRVYYGGKYYWIQDIYKKFSASTQPVKINEGKAEELKEFLEYTQEARNQFSNYINSREWDNKIRTECESLLICFDQLKERYTAAQNQSSNK